MSWMERKKKKHGTSKVNILNTPFLVIVESPSKCAKIESFLGFQYKCIASKGHLREIKKVSKKFEIEYKEVEDRITHIQEMKQMIECFQKENIFIATDDDREGEAIGWHICEIFHLSIETTKRILFHEVTEMALKNAIQTPIKIRMNIVYAQQARQVLDRMIGFGISPILTQLVVSDHFLSAGRCQTPTLRLLWDLDSMICKENFHYEVIGTFSHPPFLITGKINKTFPEEKEKVLEFLEKTKTYDSILLLETPFIRNESPSEPFNTSTLLQAASNQLHLCPAKTMSFCQTLYQDGYITYMRTDSKKYSKIFIEDIRKWIVDKYGEPFFNTNPMTEDDNAHEAIRVTNLLVIEHHNEELNSLYQMIWKRTIQSCMTNYKCTIYPIRISCPLPNVFYETEKEETIFLGWKIMNGNSLKNPNMDITFLKQFEKKKFSFVKILSQLKNENKDRYYTEASLISKMEKIGIGRPSTYAMLIDTIKERQYAKKETIEGKTRKGIEFILEKEIEEKQVVCSYGGIKNKLLIQELGKQVIQILYAHFYNLFNYEYTKKMEEELDKIVESNTPQIQYYNTCVSCNEILEDCLKCLKEKTKKEYKIEDDYMVLFSKKGPILKSIKDSKMKSIKPDILLHFDKLEKGEYRLEELQEISSESLGIYEEFPLYLKKGPYGFYVEWGKKRQSIKGKDLTFEKVVRLLEEKKQKEEKVLRQLEDENGKVCIRKGKYGPYAKYDPYLDENETINISVKNCPYDYFTCDQTILMEWILNELEKRKKDI